MAPTTSPSDQSYVILDDGMLINQGIHGSSLENTNQSDYDYWDKFVDEFDREAELFCQKFVGGGCCEGRCDAATQQTPEVTGKQIETVVAAAVVETPRKPEVSSRKVSRSSGGCKNCYRICLECCNKNGTGYSADVLKSKLQEICRNICSERRNSLSRKTSKDSGYSGWSEFCQNDQGLDRLALEDIPAGKFCKEDPDLDKLVKNEVSSSGLCAEDDAALDRIASGQYRKLTTTQKSSAKPKKPDKKSPKKSSNTKVLQKDPHVTDIQSINPSPSPSDIPSEFKKTHEDNEESRRISFSDETRTGKHSLHVISEVSEESSSEPETPKSISQTYNTKKSKHSPKVKKSPIVPPQKEKTAGKSKTSAKSRKSSFCAADPSIDQLVEFEISSADYCTSDLELDRLVKSELSRADLCKIDPDLEAIAANQNSSKRNRSEKGGKSRRRSSGSSRNYDEKPVMGFTTFCKDQSLDKYEIVKKKCGQDASLDNVIGKRG